MLGLAAVQTAKDTGWDYLWGKVLQDEGWA